MMLLLENTIKMALIVLFALALMPILRHRAAALRHWVLAAALVCAAVSPLARSVVPSWPLRLGLTSSGTTVAPRVANAAETSFVVQMDDHQQGDARAVARPAPAVRYGVSPATALRAIWIAGAIPGLAVLLFGLARLRRLARRAATLASGAWVRHAEDIRRAYGLQPVTLLLSDRSTLLVTWGVRHPKVLLPADANRWSEDRIRVVLLHELAHIARGDWIVQLAAELMRSVYWFNPFIWIACRRLRHESERACDDAVLNRGIDGAEYATHLVSIARELQRRPMWVPAPSIARPSSLERRVKVMLDAGVNRRPISRSASVAALLAVLTIAIPVTGVAIAQAFATLAGSVVDPMNGALPDVTLVLTNTDSRAKYEVRSDQTGRYEFTGVAPGNYVLDARSPGFAAFQAKLTLAGQNVQRDLKLAVGSLQETITVRDKYVPGASAQSQTVRSARGRPRAAAPCEAASSAGGPAIGGNIRPPTKVLDVRPQYPASMLSAGIEGTVVLRARIGTNGTVEDINVVSAPHADLASAATEAVRQWEFDSTLLNCVPIDVNMNVTLNFQLER